MSLPSVFSASSKNCTFSDVNWIDGTALRFVQGLLDPLQQTLADGCHLTRKTGENITEAGFSNVDSRQAVLSTASLINPHIIGIARK